jgi:hypothetical protein
MTAYAAMKHGHDAFVLCGTTKRPDQDILDLFKVDAAIQIFDTAGFGNTIAKHVPSYLCGSEGPCFYSDFAIEAKVHDENIVKLTGHRNGPQPILSDVGMYFLNVAGSSVYFRKKEKYSNQFEYRWLWFTDKTVDERLSIEVPEARDYCLPWYSGDY